MCLSIKNIGVFLIFLMIQGCSSVSYQTFDPLPFDQAEYDQLKKTGTGVVQGSVYARAADGTLITGKDKNVILMPVTRYTTLRFNEQIIGGKLASKNEDSRYSSYVLQTVSDKGGRFVFKNIPAGEYYIVSDVAWTQAGFNYGGYTYLKIKVEDESLLDIFLEFDNERIAEDYENITTEDLLMKIDRLGGTQGKYESDIDFFKRASNIKPFNVCTKLSEASIDFDKKTGRVQVNSYLFKELSSWESEDYSLMMHYKEKLVGVYSGQNSYGAEFNFEEFDVERLHLVVTNYNFGSAFVPKVQIDLPNNAKSDLSRGKSIYLCVKALPVEPYFAESFDFVQASSVKPRKANIKIKKIFVRLDGVSAVSEDGKVVYNTGSITH